MLRTNQEPFKISIVMRKIDCRLIVCISVCMVLYYGGMIYGFINFKIIPSKCINRIVLNIFSIHVNNIVYYVFILKNMVAWFTIAKVKRINAKIGT